MKKIYVYPAATFFTALAVALITILAVHVSVFTGILLAVFGAVVALLIARLVVALVNKQIYDSFIASEIWGAIGAGLFCWFIFNTSEAVQTTLVFGIIGAAINSLCFRFIAEPKEIGITAETKTTAPAVEPTKKEKVAQLAATLRYRFMEDGVTPNLDSPLCLDEDGNALTPDEAEAKGLGAMYAEAIEYIKTIVK